MAASKLNLPIFSIYGKWFNAEKKPTIPVLFVAMCDFVIKAIKEQLIFGIALAILISCEESKKRENSSSYKGTGLEIYSNTELQKTANILFGQLPIEAISDKNPTTPERVALGKALYFEKALSKDHTQSCNSCHNLNTYGVDNLSFSIGNDGGLGGRNSPTTLNAALHFAQFWDGREPDIESQAGGPILNPIEMAMPDEESVIKRLSGMQKYQELFLKAFPGENTPMTYDNLKKAIGAFERKLITPSRFDQYLAGDNSSLNDQEKEGLQTFINIGCTTCHSGNLLGGSMLQKFGLMGNYWEFTKSKDIDNGRFEVSQSEADKYFFKVPSLRNIEKTFPYFHDGSVVELENAVDIMARTQLGKELTRKEIDNIVLFFKSLTGEVPSDMKNE